MKSRSGKAFKNVVLNSSRRPAAANHLPSWRERELRELPLLADCKQGAEAAEEPRPDNTCCSNLGAGVGSASIIRPPQTVLCCDVTLVSLVHKNGRPQPRAAELHGFVRHPDGNPGMLQETGTRIEDRLRLQMLGV